MRSLYHFSILALIFASAAGAQIVLDPVPARVDGHQSTTPAEQLVVTNLNPNFSVSSGMYLPAGIAVDLSGSAPILYVADTGNNRILGWKNATSATLTNLQTPDVIIGQPNGYTTLPAINGGLHYPGGLLVDSKGNLYVADSGNNRVLRYPAPIASGATPDIVFGQPDLFTSNSPNQGGAISAKTLYLYGGGGLFFCSMAIDSSGNLFVADAGNSRVLRFPAATLTSGAVDPAADLAVGQAGLTVRNGPLNIYDRNTLDEPAGIAFDSAGHLFVTDVYNRLVVFPSTVSSPTGGSGIAAIRFAGILNPTPATATASTLAGPNGVVMINNSPAVMDSGENRMLFFDAFSSADWGTTPGDTTLANPPPAALAVLGQGSSLTNFTSSLANAGNAQPSASTFNNPVAAAVGANGDLFVVDSGNNRVLVFANGGQTATAAVAIGQAGFSYDSPNSIHGAEFYFGAGSSSFDAGIAVDSSSGTPHLYISDPGNHRVLAFGDARKFGPGVPADLVIGEPDLMTAVCNYGGMANGPTESLPRQPTASSLCHPTGLAVDPGSGDLYVADTYNGRVLRFPAPFTAAVSLEAADLVLGQAAFTGISNPQASQSVMVSPYGMVFDPQRGLLVSDESANRVLLYALSSLTNPSYPVPAAAVIGQANFTATGNSVLNAPHHIAEDTIAEVYVADSGHGQIQVFTIPSGSSTDQPTNTYTGLYYPEAVWVNQSTVAGYQNDIWVGDSGNSISRFPVPNPLVTGSTPTLVMPAAEAAGPSVTCSGALCQYPAIAITQDNFGALYVADTTNRVAVHYPALAGENSASSVCAMGCQLGGLAEPTAYLAPEAFGSLYLFNGLTFASSSTTNYSLPIPTTLGGLQVLVNGQPSPVTNVLPSQVNFVVPWEAPSSGTAQVVAVNATTQQVVGSGTLTLNASSPGFFTTNAQGTGQIAALNCNQNPCENTINGTNNPANPGKYIQFFLTGQGSADLSAAHPPDGQLPSGTIQTAMPIVLIGASQATVDFSGLAPCCVGLWQINVQIPNNPANLPGFLPGSNIFPVLVDYNGLLSNSKTNNANPNYATTIVVNAPE